MAVTVRNPRRTRATRESAVESSNVRSPQGVSETVLESFRTGNEAAFDTVFRYYYPRLCQFVMQSFGLDRQDAEDIVQNAFIKVWRRLSRLPRDVSVPACLFQVTRTQALNLIAVQTRRGKLADPISHSCELAECSPEDSAHRSLLLERVGQAIAGFPRRCRDAFWLRRVLGMSYAEIGERLGMEPRTAETHVREGHRRLRERIGHAEL